MMLLIWYGFILIYFRWQLILYFACSSIFLTKLWQINHRITLLFSFVRIKVMLFIWRIQLSFNWDIHEIILFSWILWINSSSIFSIDIILWNSNTIRRKHKRRNRKESLIAALSDMIWVIVSICTILFIIAVYSVSGVLIIEHSHEFSKVLLVCFSRRALNISFF